MGSTSKYSRRIGFTSDIGKAVKHAAMYEPKRSMSNGRLVFSGLSIFLGIFFVYCSMFYVPAFVDTNKYIGFASHETPTSPETRKSAGVLSPYMDLFNAKRGFFQAGQKLTAHYQKTEDNVLTLGIRRCEAKPIIEIFKCDSFSPETITIKSYNDNSYTFTIKQNGFYYFDERAKTTSPYSVVWKRTQ